MSELTINGSAAILRATVHLPLSGVWSADLEVDTDEDLTGRCALEADGAAWLSGTVTEGGVSHGLWRGRIVGGAGGLRGTLPTRAYRDATLADVLGDALRESGEALSGTSSALTNACRLWHRTEGAAARTVAAVASSAGYSWRVLADGTVWLGVEGWPAGPDIDVTLVERDPSQRRWTLGGDVLSLAPGTLLQVRDEASDTFLRVGPVRLDLAPDAFTATAWQAP